MKGFKTQLKINNKQRTMFLQHAGTVRHAWNWAVALCTEKIRKSEPLPTAIDLHKLLVAEVKPNNLWYYLSSKCSPQQALRDLRDAFNDFWKMHHQQSPLPIHKRYLKRYLIKYKKGEIKSLGLEHEKGYPKFKRKGTHDSFYLEGTIVMEQNRIKVPRIGWLKTYETLPQGVTPKNVVISRVSNDWFISFKMESVIKQTQIVKSTGVDLGIKTLATLTDGSKYPCSQAYIQNTTKLRRLQRSQARGYEYAKKHELQPGKNYQKHNKKIAKLHQRIANIRKDQIHKLTSDLVKNHNRIIIEDLNVSGMIKNHHLASAILDGGFYEFRRQLEYKCKWNGVELVIADRWFASSKTCSCCGHKQDMPLKKRVFVCEKCGQVMDRDLNAAINLNNYTPSYGVKVCRDAKFHVERQVGVMEAEIKHQT